MLVLLAFHNNLFLLPGCPPIWFIFWDDRMWRIVKSSTWCRNYWRGYSCTTSRVLCLCLLEILISPQFDSLSPQFNVNWHSSKVFFLSVGVQVYRRFYTEMEEKIYGVLAIQVKKPANQPFDFLTSILCVNISLKFWRCYWV